MKTKVYPDIETAYRAMFVPMAYEAKKHLINKDFSFDAAQEVFIKLVHHLAKSQNKNISVFLLNTELLRACRRINKQFGFGGLDSLPEYDV